MKKWMKISLWFLGSVLVLVLMSLVYSTQKNKVLHPVNIHIEVDGENAFLTENELKIRLQRDNLIYPGQKFDNLNIQQVEYYVTNMNEVKDVRVYTQIGAEWNIDLKLRRPIARIFNKKGESFYLDKEGNTMLPSNLHTARVLVVNGDIPDKLNGKTVLQIESTKEWQESYLLDDIFYLAQTISSDDFLEALVAQIHLNAEGDFILIPQVGGHTINFGSAKSTEEVERKFEKLKIFYTQGMPYEGWRKYSEVILKFKDQIVCVKK
jgi:cell division protein FtsQ